MGEGAGGRTRPADSGLDTHTHTKEAGKCPEEAGASRGTEPGPCRARPAASRPGYTATHPVALPPPPPPRPPPMKLLPLLGECPTSLVSEVAYTYREWDFSEVELTCEGYVAKSPMRIDTDLLRMFFSLAFQLGNSIFSAQGQSPLLFLLTKSLKPPSLRL